MVMQERRKMRARPTISPMNPGWVENRFGFGVVSKWRARVEGGDHPCTYISEHYEEWRESARCFAFVSRPF